MVLLTKKQINHPKVGIIGGAGPSAGSLLFDTIIQRAQQKYGSERDNEFPFMILLNYPFSDMLSSQVCDTLIANELSKCFSILEQSGVNICVIACNTLHAFLPKMPSSFHFIHMIEETKKILNSYSHVIPLVLCTSTSAEKKLHQNFFSCEYADPKLQKVLDKMIADITLGANVKMISKELSLILPDRPILLGCTEFSYLHAQVALNAKMIFDPNVLVADQVVDQYYQALKKVKSCLVN